MTANRERMLDAAIELLGTRGLRALTHRGVDEVAGMAVGSTSNYFRTREALIEGVVGRLVERDKLDWQRLAQLPSPRTLDAAIDGLTAFVSYSLGPDRTRTVARYALFVEAASSDAVGQSLRAARRDLLDWATALLANIGAGEVECRILLDFADGLTIHQIALAEPDFDPRPQLERLVRALLSR